MNEACSVDVISRASELEELTPEWQALFERCTSATPFQSPVWVLNWWRAFAPGTLHVICIRCSGVLTAIAPCYIDLSEQTPRALPVGIGISDYLDVLIDPRNVSAASNAISAHIACCSPDVRWEFCELPPDALALALPTPRDMVEEVTSSSICPRVALPEGAADLRQVLPKHRMNTLRAAWNRARRLGEVRIEHAASDTAQHWLDRLDTLHRSRWQSDGLPGVTADRRVYRVYQGAIPALLAEGRAAIYALLIDNVCVAVNLLLIAGRRMLQYMTGYDPELRDTAPGTLLLGYAIDRAREQNMVEFDFLRGEEPYKYLWGARGRVNTRRVFWSCG